PQRAVEPLALLRAAWAAAGIGVELQVWEGECPGVAETLAHHPGSLDAVLLIGPPRRSPSTMVPGPFVVDRADRRIPVAWLPFRGEPEIARFAAGAAQVYARAASKPAAALLAQWMPHYLRIVGRM